ncbi:MAG TPA: protoporphyrinogen oxidase [Pyrinomonadaceae bacterium]|nr:protoporphyrinogen oxidase [Pyrinomonadaceae bacterium]
MIGTLNKAEREVTVVGAGVSGLLAAYALDRKGYRVTLVEERGHGGGLIQTKETPYGIAETAAHSLLATPGVVRFCEELGVELAEIRKDSRARFVVRGGRPRKFPLSFGETLSAARHAAFTRAENHLDEQDLETWGRRHVGDGAVDYLLSPMVQGIYGVRPADLGVVAAFPELSLAPGSTLLGKMLGKAFKRGPKDDEKTAKTKEPKQRKRMVAPLRGMGDVTGRLQQVLNERLGERFRKGEAVTTIPEAPNVIIATPAYVAARLLAQESPRLSAALDAVRYTPIVSVTAFVPTYAFTRPVKGVGVLVPPREGRKSLGILFNSSAFEGRVKDESRFASFTILFGGTSQPHWVDASDEEIARAVAEELEQLLGIRGGAAELVINRWRRAIPQYSTSLPAVWRAARETWCAAPGRVLFGNYTGQVSLRGMIETALRI